MYLDTASSMEIDLKINAFLGDIAGTHGSQLRIRDFDDGTTHLHEAGPSLQPERC